LELFGFKDEEDLYNSRKLKSHATAVVKTVGIAVGKLEKLDEVVPVLQSLAVRHVGYGVEAPHYDVVGKALMQTLEAGLGSAFSSSARVAWSKVWHAVSTTMLEAAKSVDHKCPLSESEVKLVKDTWASAESLGLESVGVLLFKNIFELAPRALELFAWLFRRCGTPCRRRHGWRQAALS